MDLRQRNEQLFNSLVYLRDQYVPFTLLHFSHPPLQFIMHIISRASNEELANFTFSLDYPNGNEGEMKKVEFVENGENVVVTRENVDLYVHYVAQFYLCDSIVEASSFIRLGITDVLSTFDFSVFDAVGMNIQ